jgi:Na+-transporting NADH:ubiquinone oxidoreductase subunit C
VKPELIKEKTQPVLFMAGVTFVAITLVGLVDIVTRPAVERNKTLFQKQAVCDAAGVARPESPEALVAWYDESVTAVTNAEGSVAYQVVVGQGGKTLVLKQQGPGLWGTITAYVGFNGEAIAGVTFQDHVETPGLGARIDEPWFRKQFVGKSGPFSKLSSEPKDKTKGTQEPGAFDQITGATITSTAVKDIMNKSIQRARQISADR